MKVNMTPNPLDVVTIHASQGDSEARQWEFELHNNGELIDTSDVTDQMVFKAYEGGTEQILPENGAVPVTAPFVGDIKYPDATRTDQEFLYRQSPTEEDGYAKIKSIKGNTLVWNQLCRTLTSGNWAIVGAGSGTLTFADGVATFSTTNNYGRFLYTPNNLVSGHKYLLSVEIKAYTNASINYALGSQSSYGSQGCICSTGTVSDANWHRYTSVGTFTSGTDDKVLVQNNSGASNLQEIQVRNIMYFDLTQMGLDITDPSEFISLFSKPYYDYCQGAMLSFGGRNVKFNQLVEKGNMTDGWTFSNSTGGYSNNILTFTASAQNGFVRPDRPQQIINGHKYLGKIDVKGTSTFDANVIFVGRQYGVVTTRVTTQWQTVSLVITNTVTEGNYYPRVYDTRDSGWDAIQIRNCMLIDLTEMFGAGNEPSAEGFKELFPNDYYEYNVGQYMNLSQPLSLKTVSKNQFNVNDVIADAYVNLEKGEGSIHITYDGTNAQRYRGFYMYRAEPYVNGHFLPKQYTVSFDVVGIDTTWVFGLRSVSNNTFDSTQRVTMNSDGHYSFTFNPSQLTEDYYLSASRTGNKTTAFDITFSNIQMEIGTETGYEPFEESTLSIPLDEFPNGMDGFNDVRDYKNETGYVKAIGEIILNGNEPWKQKDSSGNCWMDFNSTPIVADYRETMMATVDVATSRTTMTANSICGYNQLSSSANYLYFRTADAEQTAENVIAYLQAHPVTLKYVLKVPIENYGLVDLGTLNWYAGGTNSSGVIRMGSSDLRSVIKKPSGSNVNANVLCNIYVTRPADHTYTKNAGISINATGDILVYDSNYNTSDKISAFKQAMQGVYLLYEKENPQGFTMATLVTENGEVALANENGVLVGKCNSDVSADAGFIEGKIKLSDSDGDVYSNKIQIHVERSPQ